MYAVIGIVIVCVIIILIIMGSTCRSQKKGPHPYKVVELPGFLTPEQCDHLIRIARQKGVEDSHVYEGDRDAVDHTARISKQAWLTATDDDIVRDITRRIAIIVQRPVEKQESMQIVYYEKGGKYDPHFDACNGDSEFCDRLNEGGPRRTTFLIYLNDGFVGGETRFPEIDRVVVPEKGKAIMFHNVDRNGEIIPEALHGGNPVIDGQKWIANVWIH
jgi:prolyl 4-hydroxylase